MKQKHINKLIPNTSITVKEFKELIYDKFEAYPMMRMNYRKNQFEIVNTFYTSFHITQNKLVAFCKKLGISHELEYVGWSYSEDIVIKLDQK
jgi:hypothetical protein